MKKYNWGILGTGAIANEFAEDLALLSHAIPYSCYSRTFDKAQRFVERHGFNRNYAEFEEFLQDPRLDIIYIATPNHQHHTQAIRCLEAGKHILVEKPLALNARQAREIAEAAQNSNRFCMEAMWSRFMPVYEEIRKIIDQQNIGQIRMISADFGHPMVGGSEAFRFSTETGGGALMDLGVYPISLAVMLLGKPDHIQGTCYKGDTGIDLHNSITLTFRNGATASLRSSFECRLANDFWIGTDRGAIEIFSPMYRPDRFKFHKENAESGNSGMRGFFNNFPRIKKSISFIKNKIPSALSNRNGYHKIPFMGNGYYHEALEVMEGIEQNILESPIMSLDESISILEITDKLRSKWNITFG